MQYRPAWRRAPQGCPGAAPIGAECLHRRQRRVGAAAGLVLRVDNFAQTAMLEADMLARLHPVETAFELAGNGDVGCIGPRLSMQVSPCG